MRHLTLLAATVLLIVRADVHAGGVVDVEVPNHARVLGTLNPALELETVRIDVPDGAFLTLTARGVGRGPTVGISVFDPSDQQVAVTDGENVRGGVHVPRLDVAGPGLFRVDVRGDGQRAGNYKLDLAWGFPSPVSLDGDIPFGQERALAFRAEAGTRADFVLESSNSAVDARLVRIEGPAAFTHTFSATRGVRGVRHRAKGVRLPSTGLYTLFLSANGAEDLPVTGEVKLRPPARRRRVNLREKARGVGDGRVVARRIDTTGGRVEVPRLDLDQAVVLDVAGAAVDLPNGALAAPALVSVRSTDDLRRISDATPAGVSVELDAEGAEFDVAVDVTIPFDLGAFPLGVDALTVVKRTDDGKFEDVTIGVNVDQQAGTVSFPALTFSSFQVVAPPLELAVIARPFHPGGLAATPSGTLLVASDDVTDDPTDRRIDTSFARAGFFRRLADGTLERFAGGGLESTPGTSRLDFRFGLDAGMDFVIVNSLAADVDGHVVMVVQDFDATAGVVYVVRPDDTVDRIAGNGQGRGAFVEGGAAAANGLPVCYGAAMDADLNVYVVEGGFEFPTSLRLFRIDAQTGEITTVAGAGTRDTDGGTPLETRLFNPQGLAIDSQGRLLVGDEDWLLRFDLDAGTTETLAGTNFGARNGPIGRRVLRGVGAPLRTVPLGQLTDLAFAPGNESILYAADATSGIVWRFDLARDRAYIAAGRRLRSRKQNVQQSVGRRPRRPSAKLRFPVAAQPLGAELYITELFNDQLRVLRPK